MNDVFYEDKTLDSAGSQTGARDRVIMPGLRKAILDMQAALQREESQSDTNTIVTVGRNRFQACGRPWNDIRNQSRNDSR